MNFSNIQNFGAGTHGFDARFKDFDSDGDLDILSITSGSAAPVYFHVFKNTNGIFTKTSYDLQSDQFFPNYEYSDLNNDGLMDVASNSETHLRILYQNPDHSFSLTSKNIQNSQLFAWEEYFFDYKDYNHDSLVDMVANRNYKLQMVNGINQTPSLNINSINNTIYSFDLHIAPRSQFYSDDVDEDGYMDIISYTGTFLGTADDSINIFYDPFNYNNSRRRLKIALNAECIYLSLHALLVEDFNSDGKKDLLALGLDDKIRVFLKQDVVTEADQKQSASKELEIFPLPSQASVSVHFKNSENRLRVFNLLSQEQFSQEIPQTGQVELDLRDLPQNVFYIIGFKDEQIVSRGKILRN